MMDKVEHNEKTRAQTLIRKNVEEVSVRDAMNGAPFGDARDTTFGIHMSFFVC